MNRFIFNDISLNIPPESIQIEKYPAIWAWSSLRTESSVKKRSGFSEIVVKLNNIAFTDQAHEDGFTGYEKLQAIVAQVRVTPFVYIEDEYLRASLLGGISPTHQKMIFAVKKMSLIKDLDSTNVIKVDIELEWFNYQPYSPDYTYKVDILTPRPVTTPAESMAWKRLWQAELSRHDYMPILQLGTKEFTTEQFSFTEFNEVTVGEYQTLLKKKQSIDAFQKKILNTPRTSFDQKTLEEYADEVGYPLGETTSMGKEELDKEAILDSLTQIRAEIQALENALRNLGGWHLFLLDNGKPVRLPANFTSAIAKDKNRSKQTPYLKDDRILIGRTQILDTVAQGLITNAIMIEISYEGRLVSIPMSGYTYPTMQHLGGPDIAVTLSMATTSDASLAFMSQFYSTFEEQALKWRHLPMGHRTLVVENALTAMCGLKHFVVAGFSSQTIPGSPGTYSISIDLMDSHLNPETTQAFVQEGSFLTSQDIRTKIVEILQANISPILSEETEILGDENTYASKTKLWKYIYTGSHAPEDAAFKAICEDFLNSTQGFNSLVLNSIENLRKLSNQERDLRTEAYTRTISQATSVHALRAGVVNTKQEKVFDYKNSVLTFYRFKNSDIPGIERLQNDIKDLFLKNDAGFKIQYAKANDPNITKVYNPEDIREFTQKYLDFIYRFLDKIHRGFLNIKQFQPVFDLIQSKNNKITESPCYPDFPLDEMLLNLQRDKVIGEEAGTSILRALENQLATQTAQLRNVDLAALIGPDCYMYNPLADSTSELIGSDIITKAVNRVKTVEGTALFKEEQNWFQTEYAQRVIGTNRALIIEKNAQQTKQGKQTRKGIGYTEGHDNGYYLQPCYPSTYQNIVSGTALLLPEIIPGTKANLNAHIGKSAPANIALPHSRTGQVQHTFDAFTCLDNFPAQTAYTPGSKTKVTEPGEVPKWNWPTDPDVRTIPPGGEFGNDRGDHIHQGVDLIQLNSKKGVDSRGKSRNTTHGRAVFSAAGGRISNVKPSLEAALKTREGVSITIDHGNGWETKYFHLQWDSIVQNLSDAFHSRGIYKGNEALRTQVLSIPEGSQLRIGSIGNTGTFLTKEKGDTATQAHLHFEMIYNKVKINPIDQLNNIGIKSVVPQHSEITGISPQNESLLTKSLDQFEKEFLTEQGYNLNRAFPTFRLYFIESDLGERKRFEFDDFYSYSSINAIEVIRSRKLAADLCIISLNDQNGLLRRNSMKQEKLNDRSITNTINENPTSSINLKPGMQIQLRLGYNSNPEELEIVFNGVITTIENEGEDTINLICQSFAIELLQNTYDGETKERGGLFSGRGNTGSLLTEIMALPEVSHFGRWEPGTDASLNAAVWGAYKNNFERIPAPQDDNIWAPPSTGISDLAWFSVSPRYVMHNSTIWDVFQEMCLRHPGYIACAVPYKGKWGPRMTMFFGIPNQVYFARDTTDSEDIAIQTLASFIKGDLNVEEARSFTRAVGMDPSFSDEIISEQWQKEVNMSGRPDLQNHFDLINLHTQQLIKRYAKDKGIVKSFRSYHLLTSQMHILKSNIKNELNGTYNFVTVQYNDYGSDWTDLDAADYLGIACGIAAGLALGLILAPALPILFGVGAVGVGAGLTTGVAATGAVAGGLGVGVGLTAIRSIIDNALQRGGAKVDEKTNELTFNNIDTFSLGVEAGIPDHEKREVLASYPNCVGEEMARMYAVSLLWRSMKDGYSGEITILGNPHIKPYDVCYLFDTYEDIFGPVEVEQVVHSFSPRTGFITIITPDMCVHVNEHTTLSTQDAISLCMEHVYFKAMGVSPLLGLPVGAVAAVNELSQAISNYKIGALGVALVASFLAPPLAPWLLALPAMGTGIDFLGSLLWNKLGTKTQCNNMFRYSPLVQYNRPMTGAIPLEAKDTGFFLLADSVWKMDSTNIDQTLEGVNDMVQGWRWDQARGDVFSNWVKIRSFTNINPPLSE